MNTDSHTALQMVSMTAFLDHVQLEEWLSQGELSGKQRLPDFKLHCLAKERQGCAEKLGDANGHTNKFLWNTFRMELYQDNYPYASFLPFHNYHFFYLLS